MLARILKRLLNGGEETTEEMQDERERSGGEGNGWSECSIREEAM